MPELPSPMVTRDTALGVCPQAEAGSRAGRGSPVGAGWHEGQARCPDSHLPLSGLNLPLPDSALFSAQLENKHFGVVGFFPSFPNLDGPKAPQADKGEFIPSLCLWRCWNMLLPQILHQGSVGKVQLPQRDLTLTYICPSPLTASSHAPTSHPSHAAAVSGVARRRWLWPCQSLCHRSRGSWRPRLLLQTAHPAS